LGVFFGAEGAFGDMQPGHLQAHHLEELDLHLQLDRAEHFEERRARVDCVLDGHLRVPVRHLPRQLQEGRFEARRAACLQTCVFPVLFCEPRFVQVLEELHGRDERAADVPEIRLARAQRHLRFFEDVLEDRVCRDDVQLAVQHQDRHLLFAREGHQTDCRYGLADGGQQLDEAVDQSQGSPEVNQDEVAVSVDPLEVLQVLHELSVLAAELLGHQAVDAQALRRAACRLAEVFLVVQRQERDPAQTLARHVDHDRHGVNLEPREVVEVAFVPLRDRAAEFEQLFLVEAEQRLRLGQIVFDESIVEDQDRVHVADQIFRVLPRENQTDFCLQLLLHLDRLFVHGEEVSSAPDGLVRQFLEYLEGVGQHIALAASDPLELALEAERLAHVEVDLLARVQSFSEHHLQVAVAVRQLRVVLSVIIFDLSFVQSVQLALDQHFEVVDVEGRAGVGRSGRVGQPAEGSLYGGEVQRDAEAFHHEEELGDAGVRRVEGADRLGEELPVVRTGLRPGVFELEEVPEAGVVDVGVLFAGREQLVRGDVQRPLQEDQALVSPLGSEARVEGVYLPERSRHVRVGLAAQGRQRHEDQQRRRASDPGNCSDLQTHLREDREQEPAAEAQVHARVPEGPVVGRKPQVDQGHGHDEDRQRDGQAEAQALRVVAGQGHGLQQRVHEVDARGPGPVRQAQRRPRRHVVLQAEHEAQVQTRQPRAEHRESQPNPPRLRVARLEEGDGLETGGQDHQWIHYVSECCCHVDAEFE